MARMKMELCLEVEDGKEDVLKRCEHHIEALLDLDSYPEIQSVSDVQVSAVDEAVSIPQDKIYFISDREEVRDCIYAEDLQRGATAFVKDKVTGDVARLELVGMVRQSYHLDHYDSVVSDMCECLYYDVFGVFEIEDDVVCAFFQYRK